MPFDIHNIPAAELPRVLVRPALLTPQQVAVASEGELVAITVGNATLRLHYADALTLSQWIRVRAKQSKRRAGDTSRHWSAVAVMDPDQR